MPERERVVLTGIAGDAFLAEADRRALEGLQRVPLMPQLIRKFSDLGLDRWFYCTNMSMSVRVGPNQFKTVYGIFQESCRTLDMPEPELYITSNPFPNAFAGGVERPFITLRSAVLDTMSDEQMYHLIGHELGHIKCGHLLYRMVARVLMPLMRALGRRFPIVGDAAAIALIFAFYEWLRQAEISADRGGLLVSQDLDTSLRANLALAAGPSRFAHEADLDAFMEQARAYQEAGPLDQLGKVILFFVHTGTFTHPMPVHRAQQLEKWAETGAYRKIIRGIYKREEAAAKA
ncbi:MAG: M48 family metallopeptidase [Armatimonadetes bacterium]|nr:M48 family metallopeptidase [Armatimonadota bacterium]